MSAKLKIAGLMMVVVVSVAPMVYADNGMGNMGDKDGHHDGAWHHGPMDHMMAKLLNLSDDQVKQLKALHETQKDAMKAVFEQMKTSKESLNDEIIKATPDMTKVNTIVTQLKALQSQMVDAHLNDLLAVKKILSPEQFVGYMTLAKERRMKMHRHQMGMEHHQFGPKGEFCKMGQDHKSWGDKSEDQE